MDLVSKVISALDDMTQKNAELVEETNSALQSTNSQIDELRQAVAFFKTGDGAAATAAKAISPMMQSSENPVRKQQASLARKLAVGRTCAHPASASVTVDREWLEF